MGRGRILLAVALLLVGCRGRILDPGSSNDGTNPPGPPAPPPPPPPATPEPPRFTCDPAARPPELPLRRLSKQQLENTLTELVRSVAPAQAQGIMSGVEGELAKIPADQRIPLPGEKRGGHRRLDQALAQEHVDGLYAVATALGQALAEPGVLGQALGSCATDADTSNDAQCIDDFILRFGERALRRPVSAEDLTFYRQVYGATGIDAPAFSELVGVLLQAPELMYFVEHGVEATASGGRDRVSAFELASRLSFHFWQTIPDEALFAAARSGALLEDGEYRRQVERLMRDPRTRASLDEFMTEWLWLDDLPPMNGLSGTPVYEAFADGYVATAELRQHMVDELTRMGAHYVLQTPGVFEDLLTSPASFATTPDVASLYAIAPWSGSGDPPALPDPARKGVLTRVGMLATGTANTRPIMRGVFLRKGLLCDVIPPPPPAAAAAVPMLSADLTTREVVEQLTEQAGTGCSGCHTTLINPLGFPLEGFDALGRARTAQRLFDEAGVGTGSKPVDTRAVPRVRGEDSAPVAGSAELVARLVASGKPQACFARTWFRFTFGRNEDVTLDGCTLESVRGLIEAGAPLYQALAEVALSASFRERSFE